MNAAPILRSISYLAKTASFKLGLGGLGLVIAYVMSLIAVELN